MPPRRTNAGPVRRGVSDMTSLRGLAEQRGVHKPVANGGIVAEELSDHGLEPGQPGAPGDRRQLMWVQSAGSAVLPFVRPIASEYPRPWGVMEYRNKIGATTPTRWSRSSQKGRSCRSCTTHPKGDYRGQARSFLLWFPTSRVGFILHIPSPPYNLPQLGQRW